MTKIINDTMLIIGIMYVLESIMHIVHIHTINDITVTTSKIKFLIVSIVKIILYF